MNISQAAVQQSDDDFAACNYVADVSWTWCHVYAQQLMWWSERDFPEDQWYNTMTMYNYIYVYDNVADSFL